MKRIPFRLEDTQEYQDLLRQQEVEQSRTPASAIAQALRAKNVGPVAVDPAAKAQREYDYATQPPEVIQQGIAMLPEAVQPVAELLAPSRADLLTAGVTKLGSLAAKATGLAKPAQGMVRELITYHGTPHTFPAVPDNPLGAFDASKIGTGEGAQAYGHGIYLAESPGVAASYRNLIARDPSRLTVDGNIVSTDDMYGRAVEDVARLGTKAALQHIDDNIRFNEKYAPDIAELYKNIRAKIETLDPKRVSLKEGAMYTADLPDAMIDRMLDWDKPLSDQPFNVQMAIYNDMIDAGYSKAIVNDLLNRKTGMEFFRTLHNGLAQGESTALNLAKKLNLGEQGMLMGAPALVSAVIRQMGIPGIKYLDASSRGTGKGTRNFVVFPGEESNVKILKRE